MDLALTPHAIARMQQRGIRSQALDVLLDFGRISHMDRGRDIVSDGTVITEGHRYRRIPRA